MNKCCNAMKCIENWKIEQKYRALWMEPILCCNDSYNHKEIAYGLASKQFKKVVGMSFYTGTIKVLRNTNDTYATKIKSFEERV